MEDECCHSLYHRPRAQISLLLSPGQSGFYLPCLEHSVVEELKRISLLSDVLPCATCIGTALLGLLLFPFFLKRYKGLHSFGYKSV